MPGFGDGPFGQEPFGQWKWSRQVLFDLLPGLYKDQDAATGGALEQWSEALRPSFDNVRDKIETFTDLRDPLKVRTQYNEISRLRLGKLQKLEGRTLQRGVDGVIAPSRTFSAVSARFTSSDIGRPLKLSKASVAVNNRTYVISAVLNTTTVRCDPPLVADAGPLVWSVLDTTEQLANSVLVDIRGGDVSKITPGWTLSDGQSDFQVLGRQQFFSISEDRKALTDREGLFGSAGSTGDFVAEVPFTQQDVGKKLTIFTSTYALNNGKYEILSVDPANPNRARLWALLTIAGEGVNGGLIYEPVPGQYGVTVQHRVRGTLTPLGVAVSGTDILVEVATDASGAPMSTATQVAMALALSDASNLVLATPTGTGAGVVAAVVPTVLPGARLLEDVGPIGWALLPFPQLELAGTALPKGTIEQEGIDGSVALPDIFSAFTAQFTPSDVGKLLRLSGSQLGGNGSYLIKAWLSTAQVQLEVVAPLTSETGLTWEVRTKSSLGDFTQVDVSAPSLITNLAKDFAIEIDARESEARQRSWVENVTQWIDLKGNERAYEILGAISGFNVKVSPLYRIDPEYVPGISGAHVYQLGEDDRARNGTDGRLYSQDGIVYFTAPKALFTPSDVGAVIRLSNVSEPSNEGVHQVGAYIDEYTVSFVETDTSITPDSGLGTTFARPNALAWNIAKIYADRAPLRPNFDEINGDLMQSIVGNFLIDSYCWDDPNLTLSLPVNIIAATGESVTGGPVTFTVVAEGIAVGTTYSSCGVVTGVGSWKITDSDGNAFYLETIPEEITSGPPPQHTLDLFSSVAPAVGPATLKYVCKAAQSCGYCKSYRVLAVIEEGSIANETGVARERVLERVISRLQTEAKPMHVELLPVYRTTIQSSFNMKVEITAGIEINNLIYAFFTGYFDVVGGDVIASDTALQVTVTTLS